MALDKERVESLCQKVAREVKATHETLSMFFIIHNNININEMFALAEHEIITHRSGSAAQAIIRKQANSTASSFLGMAALQEKGFLGFTSKDHGLAIMNINTDDFETPQDVILKLYHLAWHAIDLFEIRQNPNYKNKFQSGPMIPKRSELNLTKANLQADAFATILVELKGKEGAIKELSLSRAEDSLKPETNGRPENYAFIIARDACSAALAESKTEADEKVDLLTQARKASLEVGQAFDENNIKQWWDFCKPAQDMAWRGFSQEDILGAAVNTCDDPFTRSTGLLVSEVLEIEPSASNILEYTYNPFVDTERQRQVHGEIVESVFEGVISMVEETDSSRALMNAANAQNEGLSEGNILGWCANALQEAAKAFERALSSGASPLQAARMNFEGTRGETSWDMLKELGDEIVDQRRQGFAVTMGHIAEISSQNPSFAPVLSSLQMTMSDPGYTQKLEAANDLALTATAPQTPSNEFAPNTPAPKGPAPKGPAPEGPAPTAAPATPAAPAASTPVGPGMNKNAARIKELQRQKQLAAQEESEQGQGENSDQTDKPE